MNGKTIRNMKINYQALLRVERIRPSTVSNRNILTESESDRGRVLFCAAFRRLQQKAQVFSMEPNAAVRSRLTHSLEVSQVGRYIADQITIKLGEDSAMDSLTRIAMVNFVETACLMHDIGNPPFGHFGEAAIKKWFLDNGASAIENSCTPYRPAKNGNADTRLTNALADFLEFDGNPQGLRVVARLQWNTDSHGLNLTKTTLASYLKYVRMAGEPKPANESTEKFRKKAGYFSSEKELVAEIWSSFGFTTGQRFPLAYIMEAADDIAYCISDLEDSIEKGLLDQKSAIARIRCEWLQSFEPKEAVDQEINNILAFAAEGKKNDREFTFTDFRTSLNRVIVDFVASRYVDQHDAIIAGTLDTLLPLKSGPGSILETLKNYCKKNVYRHESVERTELAGYTAIYGLLDHFSILLKCSADRFDRALQYENKDSTGIDITVEKKFLRLFPPNYIKVYRNAVVEFKQKGVEDFEFREWNARAHLIVDFVSGMTDDFAMNTYRLLSGMRL